MAAPRTASDIIDRSVPAGRMMTIQSLLDQGISKSTLWRAMKDGRVVQAGRGVICLPETLFEPGAGAAATCLANPNGVVCLLSAAQMHEITDEDPSRLWIALPREVTRNLARAISERPLQTVWWTAPYFEDGIEVREMLGVEVRMTDLPRTVVDLIRLRSKLGDEPAMRALHDYIRIGASLNDLWDRAKSIGHLEAVEPFIRSAEEFRESIPTRTM